MVLTNQLHSFSYSPCITKVCVCVNLLLQDEGRKSEDSGEDRFNEDDEDSGDRDEEDEDSNAELLITTNDSRIRLCSKTDYSTICKYKVCVCALNHCHIHALTNIYFPCLQRAE